jgi:hypothetical protein
MIRVTVELDAEPLHYYGTDDREADMTSLQAYFDARRRVMIDPGGDEPTLLGRVVGVGWFAT